jgi:hypothetical protein
MGSDYKVSADQRQQMIAEAAYFRAERRGFDRGDPLEDWCEAEAEVDARLRELADEHLRGSIEEGLAAARRKVATLKRKIAGMSAGARMEWQQDADKLSKVAAGLQPALAKLREQSEHAGQNLRQQAEQLRAELASLVHRLGEKRPH